MEWKRKSGYGDSTYFKGKDTVDLGDDTKIVVPMLKSRAVWDERTKVLEIYLRFRTPWRIDEVATAKAIKHRFAEMLGTSRVICDVQCLRMWEAKGYCTNRLAWYAVLNSRPSAEAISKCRQIAENAAARDFQDEDE